MLKISKDNMVLEVTRGAFKSVYGPSGWAVVEDTSVESPQEPPKASGEAGGSIPTPNHETPSEGHQEPPETNLESDEDTLSNMTEDELRQYASLLGIKVKDLKTREKLIRSIKAHQK